MNFKELLQYKKIVISANIAILVLTVIFVGLIFFFWKWEIGDGYYKKTNKIYYNNELVTNHSENFKLLGHGFAKNKNLVFYLGKNFSTDVDFQKLLSKNLLVTTKSIYYFDSSGIKRIRGVDGKTFELLNNNYGKDKDLYYYVNPQTSSTFTCVMPEFIDNNEEYDIKCVDSYFKQGQFVKYTEQYQDYLDAEKTKKEFDEANSPKNNRDILKELFGEELSDYEYQKLNVSNVVCDESLEEAINNTSTYSEHGGLLVNDQKFSADYSCSKFNEECDNIKPEQIKIAEKISNNIYNIANGCLYKNNESVFKYNLLIKKRQNFFHKIEDEMGKERYWENIQEFHRFEQNGYLYIYLFGGAGCGGCIFNGPFLKINLSTGEITGEKSNLPYIPNLFVSPNDSRAIEVVFNLAEEEREIKLFLYDFLNNERIKPIYTLPQDKTILVLGHGEYPIKDSIKWLDKNTIQLQLYKRSDEEWVEAITVQKEKEDNSDYVNYETSGEPIILKVE